MQPPAFAADKDKVVIGQSSRVFLPGTANMWIGTKIGLFGPDLIADGVGTPGATENLQLMLGGKVTLSAGTQDVVLAAMASGADVPAVSPCIYLRGMVQRVAVLEDSPIKSFADLKGKRVGSPALSSTQVPYLKFALRAAGVDPDTVHIIAVGSGQQAAAAITSKQIDAYVAVDVEMAGQQAAHVPLRILPQPDSIKDAGIPYSFAFQRAWYEGHKDEAVAVLQGMIKSIILTLENPEAATRISYAMHPEALPTGISYETAIQQGADQMRVRAYASGKDAMGYKKWCEFSPSAWTRYIDMLGLTGKVDPNKFYTDELIDRVNNFDEGKFRAWAKALKGPDQNTDFQTWAAAQHPPQ
jgi:NitT/TauT family transport system substrate-binding protein